MLGEQTSQKPELYLYVLLKWEASYNAWKVKINFADLVIMNFFYIPY